MKACAKYEERLALLAAGGEGDGDAEAERHLAGCAACREELAATRRLLRQVRASEPPPPATDARFWQDFGRGVRLAHDEAARRPSWIWVWALAAAGAALALIVWVRASLPGRDQVLGFPEVALRAPPALPVGDDPVELSDGALAAILTALAEEDEDPGSDSDDDLALASAGEIEATLDELDPVALDTVAERL